MTAFALLLCFVGIPISFGYTLPKLLIAVVCAVKQGAEGMSVPNYLHWPITACFAALLISYHYSISPAMSMYGRIDSWAFGVLPCALYLAIFAAACVNPPTRSGMAAVGALVAVHALAQLAGLDPLVPVSLLPAGHRAIAGLGSTFDLGAILAMLFFMADGWILPAVMLAGLWAAGSRGGALAVAAGTVAALRPRLAKWVMAASFLFFLVPCKLPKDLARRELWLTAKDSFIAHPFVGTGPDTFLLTMVGAHLEKMQEAIGAPGAIQAHAHNDLLQAASTTGLLGLLAYLWFIFSLPASPSIVALFVFMKFNTVSMDVLVIGAMMAGIAVANERGIVAPDTSREE